MKSQIIAQMKRIANDCCSLICSQTEMICEQFCEQKGYQGVCSLICSQTEMICEQFCEQEPQQKVPQMKRIAEDTVGFRLLGTQSCSKMCSGSLLY